MKTLGMLKPFPLLFCGGQDETSRVNLGQRIVSFWQGLGMTRRHADTPTRLDLGACPSGSATKLPYSTN